MSRLNGATVLGIGNILLRDEGIGVRAVEALTSRYELPEDVTAIDGGTMGLDLLPFLKKGGFLLIIDALKAGKDIGQITRLEDSQVPSFISARLSPHQIGLQELLATAKLIDSEPAKTVMLGIEPGDLSVGLELSPEVASRIDEIVEMAVAELKKAGFTPRLRGIQGEINVPCDSI